MTKADIAERISLGTELTRKDSADLMETVFSIMKDTLEAGEKLKITAFGNFEVKEKSTRRGRNPQTGEELTIAARKILTFKPSNMLKDAMNSESPDSKSNKR